MSEKQDDLVAIWPVHGRFANIVWQVSDVCNFKCSYCNPGNWGAKNRNLNTDAYIQVLDKIFDHFLERGYTGFKIFFSGGEPTVWAPLIPICQFIRSKLKRPLLAINTNLSRPLSWWEENSKYFHDIVASFHVEFTDKRRYLENVEYLQYRVSYLACRMLMHDERFAEVAEMADTLRSRLKNCVIEYAPLFEHLSPHSPMHEYKDEWKREYIRTHQYESKWEVPFTLLDRPNYAHCMEVSGDGTQRGLNSNRIVTEGKNRFKGWKCWIDDSIFITPNGDIRTASCNAGSIIGNINRGTVSLRGAPVICAEERCNCGTDINIPKARVEYIGQLENIQIR